MIVWACSENGRWCGGIYKDVVFLKLLDVGLDLIHLSFDGLLATLLADSVQFAVMRLLLVVTHEDIPFLLESCDQLLTLLFWHQHSLLVSLILLFDLHLTNEVVLVIDLLLNLCNVLGHFTVGFLFKHVLLLASRQFWSC